MTENRNELKDSVQEDGFSDLELREIFGGGGAFRSGVQPPTGNGEEWSEHEINIPFLKKIIPK